MPWVSCGSGSGRGFLFNEEGAAHVVRSCHYNRLLVERSRRVTRDHGFLMPNTYEIETDFRNIRQEAQSRAQTVVDQMPGDVRNNPARLYEFLVHVREDGETAGDYYRNLCRQASSDSARSISANVDRWENAVSVAKFVRDTSAGILFVGATVLSGGAALAVGAGATGLTFTGNTQDNIYDNHQTMSQAMRNATISTSFAVVTNLLIPRGLSAVGRGMVTGGQQLTMGQNVALGLISVQANIAADAMKTALTADSTSMSAEAQRQFQRQLGARTGFEIGSMLFSSWLASRGIPARALLQRNADAVSSVTGGALAAIGDRLVACIAQQNCAPNTAANLDLVMPMIDRIASAEAYVRETAMRPV
jgi:hypothetical protein